MLVASLALAIGAAIFDITLREIDLSDAATQSQYAVYAADSGAECALYWDNKYVNAATNNNGGSNSAFATSSSDLVQNAQSGGNVFCEGADITLSSQFGYAGTATAATSTFSINGTLFRGQTPCAMVTVLKSGNPSQTTVISQGFNTCTAGPLQLERVLQVSY